VVYALIVSLSLAIIAVMFFGFGVIAQQGYMIQREIWTMKRSLRTERGGQQESETSEYASGDQQSAV
jgi:hypothetical protein